jgi:hypothetical protein
MDVEDDICFVYKDYIKRNGVRVLKREGGKWVALLPGYTAQDDIINGSVWIECPEEPPQGPGYNPDDLDDD